MLRVVELINNTGVMCALRVIEAVIPACGKATGWERAPQSYGAVFIALLWPLLSVFMVYVLVSPHWPSPWARVPALRRSRVTQPTLHSPLSGVIVASAP